MPEKTPSKFSIYWIAYISLVICLVMVFFAWKYAVNGLQEDTEEHFRRQTDDIAETMTYRLQAYSNAIIAAQGLFSSSTQVDRDEWKKYVEGIGLEKNYPGMMALSFSELVRREELETFMESVRNDRSIRTEGFVDFQIFPFEEKDRYIVNKYVEPFNVFEYSMGFDLSSEQARKETLEKSSITGLPTLSPMLKFLEDKGNGFIIVAPVHNSQDNTTIGYVIGAFQSESLIEKIIGTRLNEAGIDMEIFEDEISPDKIIYDSDDINDFEGERGAGQGLSHSAAINFGNSKLVLLFSAKPGFYKSIGVRKIPVIILIGGIAFSFLIFAVIYSIAGSGSRAIQLARKMTEELTKKQESLLSMERAMDSSTEGILIADAHGKDMPIVYCNKGFENITGYSLGEAVGKNCRFLQGKDRNQPDLQRIRSAMSNEESCKVLIRNYRKNGQMFWNELSISPVFDDKWEVRQFIGVIRDVTESKTKEEQIRQRTEELEKTKAATLNIMEDIEIANKDLVSAQEQLKQNVSELRKLDTQKDQFISIAAHELKTPLTSIKGFSDLLMKDSISSNPETRRKYLTIIYNDTRRLGSLITNILELSRMDLGTMKISMQKISVPDLIGEVRDQMDIIIRQKGLDSEYEIESGIPEIIVDKDKIIQVISNLINNAVHYTEKGKISITTKRSDKFALFSVSDTGAGIPKEHWGKIFTRFYQVDSPLTRKIGGTGLGLSISKGFVEAMGGTIWFESEVDKGTTFCFTIPIESKQTISEVAIVGSR
jgi:PAS domain S-box-containing protein